MDRKIRDFILDVIEERRSGKAAAALRALLGGLSKVYYLLVRGRIRMYKIGIFRKSTLGCSVISVGNITVGGTGKTPVVEMMARALKDGGRRVVVLSRGYKSRESKVKRFFRRKFGYTPKVVSDGDKVLLDSLEAGDEPYMLARNLKDIPVLVDRDRVKAGAYAIRRFGADTLLLDDGFQYIKLRRKYDLVLIDCTNPFGNGRLLPRGLLREPVRNLARANYIFLTKTRGRDVQAIHQQVKRLNPKAEIIETVHQPLYFQHLENGSRQPVGFIRGKKVFVVSAIARPESFEEALISLGAELVGISRFMDHHRFTYEEIEQIQQQARHNQVDAIITTEKDAVRMPRIEPAPTPTYFLRVNIKITSGARDFADCVSRICYS